MGYRASLNGRHPGDTVATVVDEDAADEANVPPITEPLTDPADVPPDEGNAKPPAKKVANAKPPAKVAKKAPVKRVK